MKKTILYLATAILLLAPQKVLAVDLPETDAEIHELLLHGEPQSGDYSPSDWTSDNLPEDGICGINRMVDNPVFGDERKNCSWVTIDGSEEIVKELKPGKTYLAHIYLHLASDGEGYVSRVTISGSGIAECFRENAEKLGYGHWMVNLYANKKSFLVWPELGSIMDPSDDNPMRVAYVPGTVHVRRIDGTADYALDDDEFFSKAGTLLGTNDADGILWAGYDNAIEVQFKFRTDFIEGTMQIDTEKNSLQTSAEPGAQVTGGSAIVTSSETAQPTLMDRLEKLEKNQQRLMILLILLAILMPVYLEIRLWFRDKENTAEECDKKDNGSQ